MKMKSKLETIKEGIASGAYDSGLVVAEDVERLFEGIWKADTENMDLMTMDLGEFSEFQLGLIDEVMKVHEEEVSKLNSLLFETSREIKTLDADFEDGKQGHQQYYLKQGFDYYFVGDLHSDDVTLKVILEKVDFYQRVLRDEPIRLIFTGDYVDRGKNHLKVLHRLLIIKALFPQQVFLLRGNHDGGYYDEEGQMILPYRVPEDDDNMWYFPLYMEELSRQNESVPKALLLAYLDLFDSLAYIAHVRVGKQHIMAVHGGLPRPSEEEDYEYLDTIAQLTDNRIVDEVGGSILHNIMWSDPDRGGDDLRRHMKRFKYTEENFKAFCKRFGVDYLVRGHEAVLDGYMELFSGRCITNYASGDTKKEIQDTAYTMVAPKVLSFSEEGERLYLALDD
jgi:hypothetical protein